MIWLLSISTIAAAGFAYAFLVCVKKITALEQDNEALQTQIETKDKQLEIAVGPDLDAAHIIARLRSKNL